MNYKTFIQGCVLIAEAVGLELKDSYVEVVYNVIKDDFKDDEFKGAVMELLRQEELFGKMPTPRQFLKYAPKRILALETQNLDKLLFLNKVGSYLSRDFVSKSEKEDFINNLTELEYLSLQASGGISELWRRVHDEDYPVATSKITKELGDFWDMNYSATKMKKRLNYERTEEQRSLADITNNLLTAFKEPKTVISD